MTLPIIEKFISISGEGHEAGKLAFFIRVAGCSLNCIWCDSKYASQPKQQEIVHTKIDDILLEIEHHSKELATRPTIVLTGGEILLYRKPLEELVKGIYDNPIQIEANGTQLPLPDSGLNLVHYNVSPKLDSSGNPWAKAIKPLTLKQYLKSGDGKPTFKFVIKTKKDWLYMEKVIELVEIPKKFVYVMPEGTNDIEFKKNAIGLVDKIIESGYNFSPRLHIYLWGNKKGV